MLADRTRKFGLIDEFEVMARRVRVSEKWLMPRVFVSPICLHSYDRENESSRKDALE